MKRLPKLILIISLAFNVAFVAAFGFAYLGWASTGRHDTAAPGPGPWWAASDLDLSDQQKRSFQRTDEELVQQVQGIEQHVAEHRAELLNLIARDDSTPEQIEAVLDEIGQLQRQAQWLVVDSLQSKQAVLGGGQREAFYGHLHDRMRCNWDERGWRGRWGGGRWNHGGGWNWRHR